MTLGENYATGFAENSLRELDTWTDDSIYSSAVKNGASLLRYRIVQRPPIRSMSGWGSVQRIRKQNTLPQRFHISPLAVLSLIRRKHTLAPFRFYAAHAKVRQRNRQVQAFRSADQIEVFC